MKLRLTEIQDEVIQKYRVTINSNSKCYRRTHAHVKERMVCKWVQRNSVASTFTLFHEIGHIETTTSSMRRAESEYYATTWAIDRCREYGIKIPESIIRDYQDYIDMEIDRGKRRGGTSYGTLNLWDYLGDAQYGVQVLELDSTGMIVHEEDPQVFKKHSSARRFFRNLYAKEDEMIVLLRITDGMEACMETKVYDL